MTPTVQCPFQHKDKYVFHASYGRGKGCCLLSPQDSIQCFPVVTEKFQMISSPVMDLQVTAIYITFKDAELNDVIKALKQTLDLQVPQVVMGDFNFDIRENNSLTKFFHEKQLKQLVGI